MLFRKRKGLSRDYWLRTRPSVALLALVLVAIMLQPGHAKAGHAATVDRALPARELFQAERIALAGFIDAEETPGDSGHDFGLPANHPTGRVRRRERIERQRFP